MTVYIAADNMITSLGFSSRENLEKLKSKSTGIKKTGKKSSLDLNCYLSLIDDDRLTQVFSDFADPFNYTKLERIAILSTKFAIEQTDIDLANPNVLFVFASVKGNVELLGQTNVPADDNSLKMWSIAQVLSAYFDNPNPPVMISNGSVSGAQAMITGARMLEAGKYKHVVVIGCDVVSKFVVLGYQSIKVLSSTPCKPFDKKRSGLTLGEGCGVVILSSDPSIFSGDRIVMRGGANTNDASHISRPSKSGDGLRTAIENCLTYTNETSDRIDYVSAHGSGTIPNDDMESVALKKMGLADCPINSFKGAFGHTLGAAGILESIATIHSMKENILIPTKGYQAVGTIESINIIKNKKSKTLNNCLKISSGFGGSNATILFSKEGMY